MLWAFIAVALTGLLAGCRFRASVLALLSAATFLVTLLTGTILRWSVLETVGVAFALAFALQLSYLTGTAFVHGQRRNKPAHTSECHDHLQENAGVSKPTS